MRVRKDENVSEAREDGGRGMKRRDLDLIYNLIRRTEWREGEVTDRLRKVEERAKWRAKTGAYGCNQTLERRIARLARDVRKSAKRAA